MIVVVDASIAAKWFFVEEHSEAVLNLLHYPFELSAPDFIYLELDSLLTKRTRRQELTIKEAFEIDDEIRSIPIRSYPALALRERAFELALETNSSIYDCIYLSLAEALQCRLVTADRRFFQALQNGPLRSYLLFVEDLDER